MRLTYQEVKDLLIKAEQIYEKVQGEWIEDELYYELEFKSKLGLPDEFVKQGVVLPTGRDSIDVAVAHTDLFNARIHVNSKGETKGDIESRDMEKKLYEGIIYHTNVSNDISPWIQGGKLYWKHGLCVFRTTLKDKYDEDDGILPVKLEALHPSCVMPDPSYGEKQWVFEKHINYVLDVKKQFPNCASIQGKKITDTCTYVIYWDKTYRCELVDGEIVVPMTKHGYGFIPYVFIESGLGSKTYNNDQTKRYVGLLRFIKDLLISESRDYSISDIVLARNSFPWFTIEGEGANDVGEINSKYGQGTRMPPNTKIVAQFLQTPPEALNQHLERTSNYIAAHAAPKSLQGQGEQGVRSGADRRLVISEAASKYQYATDAFKFGASRVLRNFAKIIKNIYKEDVNIWAMTPSGEVDIKVVPGKLKEPFTCSVEFAPISEEDEYRRHDDWERLKTAGVVNTRWVRNKMSDVDANTMELEDTMEQIRNNPIIQQMMGQYIAAKMSKVLSVKAAADGLNLQPPSMSPPTTGGMSMGGQAQEAGRALVPPSSPKPLAGSPQSMQLAMQKLRSPNSMNQQGQGGGGNRP